MARGLAFTLVLAGLLLAEPLAQERLVEVTSIRRHPPAENVQWMIAPEPGGRLRLRLTAERLVAVAFRIQMDQVVSAPAWARSDMYEMLVKVREGSAVNIDTVGPIAREIAADRFALKTHEEMRELPVYLLVRARADGTLGSRLKPAQVDCTLRKPVAGTPGQPLPPELSQCGLRQRPGVISMSGFPVDAFVRVLSNLVGRVIVNRSGLEGNWEMNLEFAPELSSDSPGSAIDRPSIFAALTEQLGLKLEASRAPVPVVAIDEIRRPVED
jgi:bla regulator protein BlaR1